MRLGSGARPRANRPDPAQLAALTPRGQSNGEIAETLVVAEQTVKTHVGRILGTLNLRE